MCCWNRRQNLKYWCTTQALLAGAVVCNSAWTTPGRITYVQCAMWFTVSRHIRWNSELCLQPRFYYFSMNAFYKFYDRDPGLGQQHTIIGWQYLTKLKSCTYPIPWIQETALSFAVVCLLSLFKCQRRPKRKMWQKKRKKKQKNSQNLRNMGKYQTHSFMSQPSPISIPGMATFQETPRGKQLSDYMAT